MFEALGVWERLAIIGGVAVFMAVVIIIVACVVCPMGCLYPYCFTTKETTGEKGVVPPNYYGSTEGMPYKTQPTVDQSRGFWHLSAPSGKDTDTSDWSDAEIIEMKQDRSKKEGLRSSSSSPEAPSFPTLYIYQEARLGFGLMYDRMDGKLSIRVVKLTNFSATDPHGAMTPYVKVRLYHAPKHFFTFRGKPGRDQLINNLDVEFQTKILRRSDDPVFNELFIVPIDVNDIASYTIKLLVCDFDKYSRHIVVGEITVQLSDVEWSTETEINYDEQLQPPIDENLGEVQVALMYLPTAEKLSLTIVKAHGLKIMENKKGTTDTVMKVALMLDGRITKRAKTSVWTGDINPVFNETTTFDVPHAQLDKVYFSITVLHQEKSTGEKETRMLIGRLYLGLNFDADAHAQWREMMNNPRKQVTSWHRIQS